jgi:hypothetical protein
MAKKLSKQSGRASSSSSEDDDPSSSFRSSSLSSTSSPNDPFKFEAGPRFRSKKKQPSRRNSARSSLSSSQSPTNLPSLKPKIHQAHQHQRPLRPANKNIDYNDGDDEGGDVSDFDVDANFDGIDYNDGNEGGEGSGGDDDSFEEGVVDTDPEDGVHFLDEDDDEGEQSGGEGQLGGDYGQLLVNNYSSEDESDEKATSDEDSGSDADNYTAADLALVEAEDLKALRRKKKISKPDYGSREVRGLCTNKNTMSSRMRACKRYYIWARKQLIRNTIEDP